MKTIKHVTVLFTALALCALLVTACEGPVGPTGPAGTNGEDGAGHGKVYDAANVFIGYIIGDVYGSGLTIYRPTISPATHPYTFGINWSGEIISSGTLYYASNNGTGNPYDTSLVSYYIFGNLWDGSNVQTYNTPYHFKSYDANGAPSGSSISSYNSLRYSNTGGVGTTSGTGTYYEVETTTQAALFGFTIQGPVHLVFNE